MNTNRRARRGLLAGVALVALAATSGVARAAAGPEATPSDLTSGITTLGFSSKVPGNGAYDSEFRYDGYIVVDKGVKIKTNGVKYAWTGNDIPDTVATEKPRGQTGIDQAYSIVNTKTVGDKDVISFYLTGDSAADSQNACPSPDKRFNFKIEVTLDTNQKVYTTPQVDRISTTRCQANGDPINTMRPIIRMPYDNGWGGNGAPNYSQAGFGYIADNGQVAGKTYPVNMWNPRQGLTGADKNPLPGNKADHVLYQVVRADGTPAKVTPKPVRLDAKSSFSPSDAIFLPPMDLSGDDAGYYKVLVWPQAQNQDDTNSATSWDPTKLSEAWQLGSIYNKYQGPDTEAPAADAPVITKPEANSKQPTKVKFEGTARNDKGITQVKLTEKGGKDIRTVGVNSTGNWWINNNDLPTLTPGTHTVVATGLDKDGKTSKTSEVTFKVGLDAPAPVITSPKPNSAQPTKVKIDGTAAHDKGIVKVKLTDKDTKKEITTVGVSATGNWWIANASLPTFTPGTHTVIATGLDKNGAETPDSQVTFTVAAK